MPKKSKYELPDKAKEFVKQLRLAEANVRKYGEMLSPEAQNEAQRVSIRKGLIAGTIEYLLESMRGHDNGHPHEVLDGKRYLIYKPKLFSVDNVAIRVSKDEENPHVVVTNRYGSKLTMLYGVRGVTPDTNPATLANILTPGMEELRKQGDKDITDAAIKLRRTRKKYWKARRQLAKMNNAVYGEDADNTRELKRCDRQLKLIKREQDKRAERTYYQAKDEIHSVRDYHDAVLGSDLGKPRWGDQRESR